MHESQGHRVYIGLLVAGLAFFMAGCVDASDVADGGTSDRGGTDGVVDMLLADVAPEAGAVDMLPLDEGPDAAIDPDGAPPELDSSPPELDGDPPELDGDPPELDGDPPDLDGGLADVDLPPDVGLPDAEVPPDVGLPDAAPPLDCPSITTGGETRPVGPCHACRAPGQIPPGFEDWAVVHVDPAAEPGGDGSAERPLVFLSAAVEGAAPRTVFALADGVHQGPVELSAASALVGRCAEQVRIVGGGRLGVVQASGERVVIDGITVDGEGGWGVSARDADLLEVRRSVVLAGQVGVDVARVGTLWIDESRVEGAGIAQVVADEAGVSVSGSVIGPGAGAGLVSAVADAPVPCAESASPVCPYRAGIYLTDSLVGGVLGRGLDVVRGRLHVRRSVIEDVDQADGEEPIGVQARQSFVVVDGQTIVRRVVAAAVDDNRGLGLALQSSRSFVGDIDIVDCGRGGLVIERVPPDELLAFAEGGLEPPGQWFPGEAWSPLPAAFEGDGFEPGADWFPGEAWAPVPDQLPFQLRPQTPVAQQSPELGLFRWARSEVRGARISGHPHFGADVSGHAARFADVAIGAISAGPALGFARRGFIPLDEPGSDVVALSEVRDLEVTETGGGGVQIAGVALVCGVGGDAGAPCSVPPIDGDRVPRGLRVEAVAVDLGRHLTIRGGTITETGGIGLSLIDSVATIDRLLLDGVQGIGVWSYGSKLSLLSSQITNVRFHNLTGRFEAVDIADGVVLEPGRWIESQEAVLRNNSIIGARRVGLLLVNDQIDLRVELALGEGRFGENGIDVVALGEGRNVPGFDGEVGVENRDEREIPPPAPPRGQ